MTGWEIDGWQIDGLLITTVMLAAILAFLFRHKPQRWLWAAGLTLVLMAVTVAFGVVTTGGQLGEVRQETVTTR